MEIAGRVSAARVGAASGLVLFALAGDARAHPNSTFQVIADNILTVSCFNGCHGSAVNGGMAVTANTEEAWYAALVNKAPSNAAALGYGKLRVDPKRPWNSFLLDKLTGDLKSGEGSPMPASNISGHSPIGHVFECPGAVEKIRAWIGAGAPHTGIVDGDFAPLQVVCPVSQPSLSQPALPGDGVQLAATPFWVTRPAREREQLTTVQLGVSSACDNTQQQCFITGIDVFASAGTEYVTVSRAGETAPIAVARGRSLTVALPAGVGVPVDVDQPLEIRQRIRNDYWVGSAAPYTNTTTGSVYVNVHLASTVDHPAHPLRDDGGSQMMLVPPQSYGATLGSWLPADSARGAVVAVWADRRALQTEVLDATGQTLPAGEAGYGAASGGPLVYGCVHANGWVPNRAAGLGSNGSNALLNTETGPVDAGAPLRWGCEATASIPPGLPALVGDAAVSCARSNTSPLVGNDCSEAAGSHRCQPANLVYGAGADDGRCSLVGLWW